MEQSNLELGLPQFTNKNSCILYDQIVDFESNTKILITFSSEVRIRFRLLLNDRRRKSAVDIPIKMEHVSANSR